MQDVQFSGNYMEDNLLLEFVEGTRESMRVVFYGIISADTTFRSQYSGYLGLAPYTASIDFREQSLNFMYQLKTNKNIDHNVVSIFTNVDLQDSRESFIKFGSYDKDAIKEGEKLTMIRTMHYSSWILTADEIKLG